MSGLIFAMILGLGSYYLLCSKLGVELLQLASSPVKNLWNHGVFSKIWCYSRSLVPHHGNVLCCILPKWKGFRPLLISAENTMIMARFPCVDEVNYLSWTSLHISMIVSEWIIKRLVFFIMYSELDKNYCSTKMKNCWGEKNNCLT